MLPVWGLNWVVTEEELRKQPSGRVGRRLQRWLQLTGDRAVLNYVRGHCLSFYQDPVQWHRPRPRQMAADMRDLVTKEVTSLVEKGALVEVPGSTPSFVSPLFVVPKKSDKMRPVADLRELNAFVKYEHFKMESITTLRELLQQGDYMVKMDLTDAYLSMPVHANLHELLAVMWQDCLYHFTAVPFGLSSAPRQFTKLLHPVVTCLRQHGARLVIYLDDILIFF